MTQPINTMTLSADQVMNAIQSWLNTEILKTPVTISDFTFTGYAAQTVVTVTLKDVA